MIIRRATVADAEFIVGFLLLAMEDIVYNFISSTDEEKAKDFLLHFTVQENNQYSYKNCWVAEEEKAVVAAANVYDGALLHHLRQPVVDFIKHHYNHAFIAEDETEAGEWYIDTIGVDPRYRGKGMGTKVLQFLVDEYVYKQHKVLGLLVDEDNPDAKRLYERIGFETVGKRKIFGKTMEHLQMKKQGV